MQKIDKIDHAIEELCETCDPARLHLSIEAGRDIVVYAVPPGEVLEQPVVAVEIWNGSLRILAYPDNSESPVIVDIGPR